MIPEYFLYIFCSMFVALATKGVLTGSLLRPTVVYTLILLVYPIVTLSISISGLLVFYWWFPKYSQDVYIEYSEIALAAIAPLFITSIFSKELPQTGKIYLSTFKFNGADRHFLWSSALLIFLFVATNFHDIFVGDYYHFAKETSGYTLLTALDYIFFFSLLLWLASAYKISLIEKVIFASYFVIKFMSGGRMFLVVCGLAAWVHYCAVHRPTRRVIRRYVLFIPILVILMAVTVSVRDRSYDFGKAAWALSQEYLNSSISSLNISEHSTLGIQSHPMMILDPIISLIPSFALDRDNFENTRVISTEFGGNDSFAPAGGMYLPHMIYLIFPSKWFVLTYYSALALFLFAIEKRIFSSRDIKIKLYHYITSLAILSIFLVFSIRHYFFVHAKTLLIILIANFIFMVLTILWATLMSASTQGRVTLGKKTARLEERKF